MSYISGFSDNALIGVDDLNAITKRLVTSGVGDILSNTGSISVTELNKMTAAVVSDGVVPSSNTSLKVSCSGGTAKIAKGTAFFADGSFIEVTAEESVLLSGGGYVYLINDTVLGVKEPRASENMPEGDVVPLAYVSESGVVTDLRNYAKGKVPSYSSYAGYPMLVSRSVLCTGDNAYERYGTFTVDLSGVPLNGIAVKGTSDELESATGVCFFDENKNVSMYRCTLNKNDNTYIKDCLYLYYASGATFARVTFSCGESGILTVNVTSSSGLNSATSTITEKVEFIIF